MAAADWESGFRQHCADLPSQAAQQEGVHYTASAERLRRLMRESNLRLVDLKEHPDRFFRAHDVLSEFATQLGPGFGIRFTVQANLFAGTIIALGNPDQVASLNSIQSSGKLGCFCLTERFAGVNSGLIVNTTAEWNDEKQMFLVNCPDGGAEKNWISQGLTADMAVIVANLFVRGKSYGAHAFLADLRQGGQLVPGVTVEDMGGKTIGNDLDNARIRFANIWLPRSALLDRFGGIEGGEYVQRKAGTSNMDMIGQRLYTGRQVIAASALIFARNLYATTRKYTDGKGVWVPKGDMHLTQVPQISTLFAEADKELGRVEKLRAWTEKQLCECLLNDKVPSVDLVNQIAALKVKAIETAILYCFKLKQEVGSYALMAGTGFEKTDYLQCCKFAEGDSRILMQKMARDRLQAFSKSQEGTEKEAKICTELGTILMTKGMSSWNDNYKLVYGLAEAVIERIVDQAAGDSKL